MTTPPRRFPPTPLRDVHIRHLRWNCAGLFAEIRLDFEPAGDGFTFAVADDLLQEGERQEDVPRFVEAVATGVEERLYDPELALTPATRVVLRHIRTFALGTAARGFELAGALAVTEAVRRARTTPR